MRILNEYGLVVKRSFWTLKNAVDTGRCANNQYFNSFEFYFDFTDYDMKYIYPCTISINQ